MDLVDPTVLADLNVPSEMDVRRSCLSDRDFRQLCDDECDDDCDDVYPRRDTCEFVFINPSFSCWCQSTGVERMDVSGSTVVNDGSPIVLMDPRFETDLL